jgi:RNA polymerase sigma-70 factor (ECF subfamily)
MPETSVSLLDRLRKRPVAGDWQRLVDLYTPWLDTWLCRQGVSPADADDLVQEVLSVVVREVPGFRHDQRKGAFRCWLRTIAVNRLRAFWRSRQTHAVATGDSDMEQRLDELADSNSSLSRLWDQEHDQHVLKRLLELVEPEFAQATWQAFRRVALEGARPAEVAAELGLSGNAVLLAKSRVLRRLREEAQGLVDS